mmetsp:Transcript_70844/g.140548  ORF Transcript_70844/g.140548 Transcript_70844/m.140548 type:complete len:216 (+) Transcript_70844:223-870(+)
MALLCAAAVARHCASTKPSLVASTTQRRSRGIFLPTCSSTRSTLLPSVSITWKEFGGLMGIRRMLSQPGGTTRSGDRKAVDPLLIESGCPNTKVDASSGGDIGQLTELAFMEVGDLSVRLVRWERPPSGFSRSCLNLPGGTFARGRIVSLTVRALLAMHSAPRHIHTRTVTKNNAAGRSQETTIHMLSRLSLVVKGTKAIARMESNTKLWLDTCR